MLWSTLARKPEVTFSQSFTERFRFYVHPILLEGFKRNEYPSDWLPESIDKIELVACWKSLDTILIDTCVYEGGKVVRRHRRDAEITLREARTGEIISTFTLKGIPRECDQTITENSASDLYGSVSGKEVITSVESFVNP